MDLLQKFLDQVTALPQFWMPCAVIVVISWIVIWRILKHHYQGRIDTKDDLIQLQQERVQDYKDKLSGATPDEAKARMDALEARVNALGPRRLTAEQRNRMVPILQNRGAVVEVASDAAAADATKLGRALADVFRSCGWRTQLVTVMGLSHPPPSGVGLTVPDTSNLDQSQQAIADALTAAGIAFDLNQKQIGPRDEGEQRPIAVVTITTPTDC